MSADNLRRVGNLGNLVDPDAVTAVGIARGRRVVNVQLAGATAPLPVLYVETRAVTQADVDQVVDQLRMPVEDPPE